jgi:hypothetical protein
MPAQRIATTAVGIRRFDVVGHDASGEAEFIAHVALSGGDFPGYSPIAPLTVVHMGPPLDRAGETIAHCVGSARLTADEQFQIGVFADEVALEYQAARAVIRQQQYVIAPHVDEQRSEDQTVVRRRFSCAGFVVEAYRDAGIDLLRTERDRVPLVQLESLKVQYPSFARLLDHDRFRADFGLTGDGPWPVVLAGHVLNALARTETDIRSAPYQAQAGDEYFPARRTEAIGTPEET